MVDGDGRDRRRVMGHGAQGNLSAGRRRQVDEIERGRALPEPRLHLHDDVVLVELGEHGRHQALAEGVVEDVVDELRREPQPGRRRAVVYDLRLQAAVLLVGADVGELGTLAHLLQ